MRFTECRKRPVLDTSTALTLGKVDGLVLDPATRSVVAVTVKRKGDADTLLWSALQTFGPDAVTVDGEQALTEADEHVTALRSKKRAALGKRVLTDAGDEAGLLEDVAFDPASGTVTALLTSEGEIAGDRLLGVGSWAVVVRAAAGASGS